MRPMPHVSISAAGAADLDTIRAMMREYHAWLGLDLCFQNFSQELAGLPGDYVPPGGGLWIARANDEPIGMIAMRRAADGRAEMKRLFVRAAARGSGVGRLLVDHVIAAARAAGYTAVILDTLPQMDVAQKLYESLGFVDVAPYYNAPIAQTRFLELRL